MNELHWLAAIKEEAAEMFREARAEPLTDMKDFDRALMSDFCRFVTMLANRVEKRLAANDPLDGRICPSCGQKVRKCIPRGGDGSVDVWVRHRKKDGTPCEMSRMIVEDPPIVEVSDGCPRKN